MAHYSTTIEAKATTPAEWLRVGAGVGKIVNAWSFRDDLVVKLGTETTSGAPASFNPKSAEIEVNTNEAFGKFVAPEDIGDLTKRIEQLNHSVASGAIFHEACHARFTRWALEQAHKDLTRNEFNALVLLEEGRIEAWGAKLEPANKVFLHASAMKIVLDDLDKHLEKLDTTEGAAHLAGLTLARVDAGVLEEFDVIRVQEVLEEVLTKEVLDKLRSVWLRVQAHEQHSNPAELYDLAKEWVKIISERRDETGESKNDGAEGFYIPGEDNESSEGGEGGEGKELSPVVKKILEALQDAVENSQVSSQGDIIEAQIDQEQEEEVEARNKSANERQKNKQTAAEVFATTGVGSSDREEKTNSTLVERRKPTSEERASAVKISRLLQKAKYRDRSVIEINTAIPGGRLRTRAAVQGAALKAKGIATQVEPWRHTKRKHTETPELKVGVMVDISGSMGRAMNPMATTAWVLSEAVRRIQGKVGMVYFGNDVFATLKPGQHLRDVQIYTAPDGTEKFGKAFSALDGEFNLTSGTGARLLVIVSDGQYGGYGESDNAKNAIKRATANGVGVLWIQIAGGHNGAAERYVRDTTAKVITIDPNDSTASVASLIGSTAANVLTAAGR
jgi:hypothetical protein